MQEHTYHGPTVPLEVRPASAPFACGFCGAGGVRPGETCKCCGVAKPSELSEISIAELLKRKAARHKSKPAVDDYTPVYDGLFDPVPEW